MLLKHHLNLISNAQIQYQAGIGNKYSCKMKNTKTYLCSHIEESVIQPSAAFKVSVDYIGNLREGLCPC